MAWSTLCVGETNDLMIWFTCGIILAWRIYHGMVWAGVGSGSNEPITKTGSPFPSLVRYNRSQDSGDGDMNMITSKARHQQAKTKLPHILLYECETSSTTAKRPTPRLTSTQSPTTNPPSPSGTHMSSSRHPSSPPRPPTYTSSSTPPTQTHASHPAPTTTSSSRPPHAPPPTQTCPRPAPARHPDTPSPSPPRAAPRASPGSASPAPPTRTPRASSRARGSRVPPRPP